MQNCTLCNRETMPVEAAKTLCAARRVPYTRRYGRILPTMVDFTLEKAMERTTINIYEIVSAIQAKKEEYRIQPAVAKFTEIKAELEGITDGELYALLDAEVDSGLLRKVRTINGYAYCVVEE